MASFLPCRLRRPLFSLAALLLVNVASAQGGYDTREYDQWGLDKVPVPRDYTHIPRQPTEKWAVLRFAEELPETRRVKRRITPEIQFVWIPWIDDPEPEPEPEAPPEEDERSRSEPEKEEKPPPPPINSLQRYVDQEMPGWTLDLEKAEEQKPRDEHERCLYAPLYRETKKGPTGAMAWIWEWKRPGHVVAMIGTCHADDYQEQSKIWTYMARKIRVAEPKEAEPSKWVRFYERRPKFKGADFRIKIRDIIDRTDGWKAEDTDNYIVIYSTKDEALIRTLKRELEAIRGVYEELFPPAAPVTAVSAVRVCKDREEYILYGGPPGSGGYWYSVAEELVFFDYEDVGRERGSGKANSRIVLYHEAFHQYIYYSAGKMAPHSWFNEGHGDYFSGARFARTGAVSKIGVNPWRIRTIQRAVSEYQHHPWEDIVKFSQAEYYSKNPGLCYAQGWSMVYFLRHDKTVERRQEWAKILPTYFDTLKAAYDIEEEGLEKTGQSENREQIAAAMERAREKALEAAFVDVNLDEIEKAWISFVEKLEVPK